MHGVKLILLVHFAINALLILEAIGLVFFPQGSWMGSDSLGFEVALAGYCLAGCAIIAAAFYGVVTKQEMFLRVYVMYMFLTFAFDSYYVLKVFVFSGPCESLASVFKQVGQSFVCGIARGTDAGIVAVAMGLQLYFLYVVWSYAEDISRYGAVDLSDLLVDEETFLGKQRLEDVVTYADNSVPMDYGAVYEVSFDGGMGGSRRIFDGRNHEMQYPPPRGLMKSVR